MSDYYLPFEIQLEIIKKLPVKSLIQFRSVSKAWKSLIDDSDFIAGYSSQQQHILVRFYDDSLKPKYVLFLDDETFPQQQASVALPPTVNLLKFSIIIGSSHGLLCLYGFDHQFRYGPLLRNRMIVIWNVSIRKVVAVVLPNLGDGLFRSVLGFGVCRETTDPKIVKITHIHSWNDIESISCIPSQVEIFTLSTGAWRSLNSNLPRKTIHFDMCSIVLDGILYWLATHQDGETSYYNLIVSFDLTSEEFREVDLPNRLARHQSNENLYTSKLRNSLVVLERNEEEMVFVVWMMVDGVSKSFTKLFTINTPGATVSLVLKFRKSVEPVIEVEHDPIDGSSLAIYEPYTKNINNLEINGRGSFYVLAYVESLLLLDQPSFIL